MSSPTLQPLIDRLTNLNNDIDIEITKINDSSSEGNTDFSETLQKLQSIREEQEEIYNLITSINENLFSNFVSAKTLNEHQNDLANMLSSYKSDIENEISTIDEQTNHRVRLSKINKYYGDKYAAHTKLIKLIIKILVPFIILAILKNKGFLPEDAFNALLLVVFAIGGILFIKEYKDVVSRDNMNFQEYDWRFRKDLAPKNDD